MIPLYNDIYRYLHRSTCIIYIGVTIAGPAVSDEAGGTLASELESVSMTTDGVVVTAVAPGEAGVLLRGSAWWNKGGSVSFLSTSGVVSLVRRSVGPTSQCYGRFPLVRQLVVPKNIDSHSEC